MANTGNIYLDKNAILQYMMPAYERPHSLHTNQLYLFLKTIEKYWKWFKNCAKIVTSVGVQFRFAARALHPMRFWNSPFSKNSCKNVQKSYDRLKVNLSFILVQFLKYFDVYLDIYYEFLPYLTRQAQFY